MKTRTLSLRPAAGTVLAALLLPTIALAQQQPITGHMMDGRTATVASAPPAAQSATTAPPTTDAAPARSTAPLPAGYGAITPYYATQVGDTTHHLLQMQVRGDLAGPPRSMLGAEAGPSYQRYLKSFEHPIPEFYEANVGKNARNGR